MNNSQKATASPLFKRAPKPPVAGLRSRPEAWKVAPDLLSSFHYASAGIQYAFRTQRNFRVHVGAGIFIGAVLAWVQASALEICLIILLVTLILALELVNTALEAVVDLTVGNQYHDLAKVAKDCAAGAVLVAAIASVLIGTILILPQAWLKITGGL